MPGNVGGLVSNRTEGASDVDYGRGQVRPHVVAVVGLAGAGKSTVARILERNYGYKSVYFGGHVVNEVRARGLPPGPESERLVREELREQHGMAAMAILSRQEIAEHIAAGSSVVIDGLYSLSELELLMDQLPVIVVAVHAPVRLRQRRIQERRNRSLSPSELRARDLSEVRRLDKGGPIALADFHVLNAGSDSDLAKSVKTIVDEIMNESAPSDSSIVGGGIAI